MNSKVVILVALASIAPSGSAAAATIFDRGHYIELINAGRWEDLRTDLTPVLAANPYQGEGWHLLGVAHARLGQCATAAPMFDRAIKLGVSGNGPGMRYAHVEAAACAAIRGDLDSAVEHLGIAQGRYKFSDFDGFVAERGLAILAEYPPFQRLAGRKDWTGVSRVDGWSADLDYFIDLVERRHPEPFHTVDETIWRDAAEVLRRQLPELTDLEVVGRFMRLAGMIGDGHTSVYPPMQGDLAFHMTPIWPYAFGDDWRIIAAAPEFEHLVGSRIIAVEGVPMAQAARRLAGHLPADNPMTPNWVVNVALQFAEVSQAVFGNRDAKGMTLELEDESGSRRSVELAGGPVDRNPMAAWAPGHWPSLQAEHPPLWLRKIDSAFWHTSVDELKLVYAQINQIRNGADQSLESFGRELRRQVTEGGYRHLVLDLRHNNGGNGYLNWPFVRELVRTEALDGPGGLFVIAGRRTFSAAMLLASMLESHTDAIFVGEPTGSSPQFYGEDTEFRLPYSGLTGSVSSRWFQNRFISDDERPWIAPDIPAELTVGDLRKGRDPAMNAIRQYLKGGDAGSH
ncbi:MAG: hypothetical protein QNJ40_23770 [Xanthomonadales bacterium]|nr:hypothetical protein [Xanthomonadales bacterium]